MKQNTNLNTDVDYALKKWFYCKANYFVFPFFSATDLPLAICVFDQQNKYTLNQIILGKLMIKKTKNKKKLTNTAILKKTAILC